MRTLALTLALALSTATAFAQENLTRLLRQPDIAGEKIAFVYAGDLWIVDARGGDARRLTADDGLEQFPKFSPDGRWIAFTGEYSGTKQVHVISVDGGQPRQLTFYNDVGRMPPRGGIDNRILDWTPDGKNILFLPHRVPWFERMTRPYIVPAAGGMETPLAIPEGGGGAFSPDGTKVVYTPIDREWRTWKRYRGGRAQDVWTFDLTTNKADRLTDHPASDSQPVWVGDTIYFASDREDTKLNLWAFDTKTRKQRKVTDHRDFDVLWPSSDSKQVVYEAGGYIWRYDTTTGKETRVPIRVLGDFRNTVPQFRNVKGDIESFAVSPTGQRALFTSRGELFTAPAKLGEIRNLTQSSGIRERDGAWSPDGRWIAYYSDRSGEYELFVRAADGTGDERRLLPAGNRAWKFAAVWSPDSKLLAYSDRDHELHILDVATGRVTDVDRDEYGDIATYRFSPDSRWLAYTKQNEARFSSIYVYNIADAKVLRLTSGMTNDNDPVFDPKGRYLYFTSNRDFNLTFSNFEFNYVYTDPLRVYVGVLAADGPALFLPQSDEEKVAAEKAAAAATPAAPEPEKKPETKGEDAAKKDTSLRVKIDAAGFEQRVRAIPGASGNYRSLGATNTGVLYLTGAGAATALKHYNVDDRKEETILEGVTAYDLSANREKLLYFTAGNYGIAAAKPGQKAAEGIINLDRMETKVDPRAEWAQEYTDAWRILRDWFYDPNMHGNDWDAIRAKYAQLVPFIAHRYDLDYILGELAGEMNAGHVYVETSNDWQIKRVENGLLGAEISRDASGYFRIDHIFPGENWHERFRSPLTEPGVRVKEGEFIVAVDGVSTKGVDNFYRLLENKAGRTVSLMVNSRPDAAGAREEKVRPITKETDVRYLDWVRQRREYVDKASGGRIGYIHVPNTSADGNRELFKFFYPLSQKEALIIDDRYNGGGFVPDRMIELLERPLLNYWAQRNAKPTVTPAFSHQGPKVMLINGYSASGGDALPYYFRKRGLGKLIGTRTWGGLAGLSNNPTLVDGGQISVPTFRFLDTEGAWQVEGVGVAPDIEVIDRPDLVAAGKDPSLEKAVEVLMDELAKNPPKKVVVPPVTVNR